MATSKTGDMTVTNLNVLGSATIPGSTVQLAKVTYAYPADTAATASTSVVMAGLGILFTPVGTAADVLFTGTLGSQTTGTAVSVIGKYGTGSAPANAAAAVGTNFPAPILAGRVNAAAAAGSTTGTTPFSYQSKLTGLTAGAQIWIDLAYKVSANSGFLGQLAVRVMDCQ